MSNFLNNIKLIASDLANMSPKTQLEIVKLCKNLCLNVKDYLVELDETTLVNITTRLDNLQDELTTAEGNIQANANAIDTINDAIDTINDAIDTINDALNNRYTKAEIDTLLNNKVDKANIGYVELNSTYGTLTDAQYNEIIKDYCIIKINSKYYYKDEITTTNIYFKSYTTITSITNTRVYYSRLNVTISNKSYNTSNNEVEVYNTTQTDAFLNNKQNTLVSGTNIKTINNESILGSGNINIGGGGDFYYHHITIKASSSVAGDPESFDFNLTIINTNNTAFTKTTLFQYLYNKGYNARNKAFNLNMSSATLLPLNDVDSTSFTFCLPTKIWVQTASSDLFFEYFYLGGYVDDGTFVYETTVRNVNQFENQYIEISDNVCPM